MVTRKEVRDILLKKRVTLIYALIIIIAMVLRFYNLDARPYHHDESVHAYFSYQLFRYGTYAYNPMWHGPFQYHLTASLYRLFWNSDWIGRVMPAIFGVFLVTLPFALRKHIGVKGSFMVAFLLAVSPSFLYYSRFFRSDIYVAFFSLAMVVCVLSYLESKQPRYLYLGSVCLALSLTAKENTYITLAVFISYIAWCIGHRIYIYKDKIMHKDDIKVVMVCMLILLTIYVLLYSSLFRHLEDALFAIPSGIHHWSTYKSGPTGPFYYYMPLLALYELPILIFGGAGIAYYALKRDRLMVFMSYWACSSLLIYSCVYEKAPWLMLHILVPLTVIAGKCMGDVVPHLKYRRKGMELMIATILILSSALFIWSSVLLYYNPTNPAEPMIQAAQPPQQFKDVLSKIDEVASQHDGKDTPIQVMDSGLFTQCLWHLRDYKNVSWSAAPREPTAPIILVHDTDASEVAKKLEGYERLDSAIMGWYWFKPSDVTLDYILYRKMNRQPDKYGIALFYRPRD
ncbi:MAG: TIGR03663 family protein [Methanocellales archaeon]|nr:TIGR03663 family protein [Methanocellales archaeon]